MVVSMVKFGIIIFTIIMAKIDDGNCQLSSIEPGFEKTNFLLQNVTDTTTAMSSILHNVENSVLPEIMLHLQNQWKKENENRTNNIEVLQNQLESLMENTFNQVTLLQNVTSTMNTMTSVVKKQQEAVYNISNSLPIILERQTTGIELLNQQLMSMRNCCLKEDNVDSSNQPLPMDCTELKDRDNAESGQYIISPQDDDPAFRVYCDMETDGGGWTVFQRREDGSVDFYLNWADYQTGFGNVNSEHWLGNEKIHRISAQGSYELRIDMADFDGNRSYAKYATFRLGNSGTNYKLILGPFTGTSGDSLSGHGGHSFTTRDRDHDTLEGGNCANSYKGGWWYTACHRSNLNGLYLGGSHDSYANGVNWYTWKGHHYSLKHVEMKMRLIA